MPRRQSIVALFSALLLAGCATAPAEEDSGPKWAGAELRPELRIGVAEGPDEFMFARISGLAVAPSGVIYVADTEPTIIRSYSSEGEYLGDIGRTGQGPGEYASISGLAALPDGRLVVLDGGNRRLAAYQPDGRLDWSSPVHGSFGPDAITADRQGTVLLLASEGEVGSETRRQVLRRFGPNGEPNGEVSLSAAEPPIAGYAYLAMYRSEVVSFESGVLQTWSPDGYLITGPNHAYEIELQRPDAPVVLNRALEPAALEGPEREDVERFVTWVKGRLRAMGREFHADPLPEVKPFFRAIEVGQEGRVWLLRYVPGELDPSIPETAAGEQPTLRWREPVVYDVWDPDATFLGTLRLPAGVTAREMRGDLIWGTEVDADGVERVVRYRVQRAGGR